MLGNTDSKPEAGSKSTDSLSVLGTEGSSFEEINKSEVKSSSFSMLESNDESNLSRQGYASSLGDIDQEDPTGDKLASNSIYNIESFAVRFQEQVEEAIENIDIDEGKKEIHNLWHKVIEDKKVKVVDHDEKNRPIFVKLQAIIEGVIAKFLGDKKISSIGTIHTPTPATPLRTEVAAPRVARDVKARLEKGLVTDEVANDPKRSHTLMNRVVVVREYLDQGGHLISAYETDVDKEGKEIAGMDIFKSCRSQYEKLSAIKLKKFEEKFTGATYIFGDKEKNGLVFSLKAYQANQELIGIKKWCVWFGPINLNKAQDEPVNEENEIEKRFAKVHSFLQQNGNIDMVEEYKKQVNTALQEVEITQLSSSRGLAA